MNNYSFMLGFMLCFYVLNYYAQLRNWYLLPDGSLTCCTVQTRFATLTGPAMVIFILDCALCCWPNTRSYSYKCDAISAVQLDPSCIERLNDNIKDLSGVLNVYIHLNKKSANGSLRSTVSASPRPNGQVDKRGIFVNIFNIFTLDYDIMQ